MLGKGGIGNWLFSVKGIDSDPSALGELGESKSRQACLIQQGFQVTTVGGIAQFPDTHPQNIGSDPPLGQSHFLARISHLPSECGISQSSTARPNAG